MTTDSILQDEPDFNPEVEITVNLSWKGKPTEAQHAAGELHWQRKTSTPRRVMETVTNPRQGHAFTVALGPARYRDKTGKEHGLHRTGANFAAMHLVGVDFDTGTSIDDVIDRYPLARDCASFAYETASSTPAAPRCRLVHCLETPITTAHEAEELQRALLFHYSDELPDPSGKDAVRVWYGAPGKPSRWIGGKLDAAQVAHQIAEYRALGGQAAYPAAGPADEAAVKRNQEKVERVLAHAQIHYTQDEYNGGRRFHLVECPFNPEDTPHPADNGAAVLIDPDGKVRALCHHKRCITRIEESGRSGWGLLKHLTGYDTGRAQAPIRNQNHEHNPDDAPAADTAPEPPPTFNRTDLGNARRLVYWFGREIRYCYAWKDWLAWDGRRWRRDDVGLVERHAKATIPKIYADTANYAGDTPEHTAKRKEIAKWAATTEARDRIRAMVDLARSEAGVPIQTDELDTHPMLLNVGNGTIDLRTGELRTHRRADLLTACTPINYDPAAACPIWDAFLIRIMGGNQELINFLQRAVGHALTGDVSEQVLFFLYGSGANGKSTFIKTILALLGRDYATQAAPELLLAGERHPTELADLRGLRFVASIEVDDGRRLAEGLVKQMTGGDVLKARFMRGDFFAFDPTFKLFLAANHKPTIRGTDHAMWRRIRLIPFSVTIAEADRDPHMPEKLATELPGILAWAVRGCLAWQREGLAAPPEVKEATKEYRAEMDTLGRYLEERTTEGTPEGAGQTVQAQLLYADYKAWCAENGEKELNPTRFGRTLTERGCQKDKDPSTRHTFYKNMGLLVPEANK